MSSIAYRCATCNLGVMVGWNHYHHFDEGYWARSIGFCRRCGTMRQVEHPALDEGKPKRTSSHAGPVSVIESENVKIPLLKYRLERAEWHTVENPDGCLHCGSREDFCEKKEDVGGTCPRCGADFPEKIYEFWT